MGGVGQQRVERVAQPRAAQQVLEGTLGNQHCGDLPDLLDRRVQSGAVLD